MQVFAPNYRRRVSGLVNPSTKNLTGYWATRGDASDYNSGTGTWAGRASAGGSGSVNLTQATAGSRPATTTIDGLSKVVRKTYADSKVFDALSAVSNFWTSTAAAGIVIIRASAPANFSYQVSSGYPGPQYLADAAGYQGAGGGQSAGTPAKIQMGIGRYDGAWKVVNNDLIPSAVLVALCFRHAGGKLQHAINAAPSSANEIACGACTSMGTALGFLTTSVLEADYAAVYLANALSDTDFTDIIAYERSIFPTGFP